MTYYLNIIKFNCEQVAYQFGDIFLLKNIDKMKNQCSYIFLKSWCNLHYKLNKSKFESIFTYISLKLAKENGHIQKQQI